MSTPIQGLWAGSGGKPMSEYHGAFLPEYYSNALAEHHAVRKAAGLFDFSFRARFSATGSDRVRFLHGMVSNDVKGLTPGRGVYATLLDVRGHILSDLRIYCCEDRFLVDTDADLIDKALGALNHYNIGGRTPLERLGLRALSIQGPQAGRILNEELQIPVPGAEDFSHVSVRFGGYPLHLVRVSSTGEEGFELWASEEAIKQAWNALVDRGQKHGLLPCGTQALETLRIEAGIAAYGSELGEDTLPLEAGLLNALSFTKGCYIGQEIVERARSRGHVNWKLAGLVVDAAQSPLPGQELLKDDKERGEITSACASPTLQKNIALAYLRREVSDPGTTLTLPTGGEVRVTPLPFYSREPEPDASGN
ncbi:MAG: aminomethyltransferase family protein [Terriglobia bacterium]